MGMAHGQCLAPEEGALHPCPDGCSNNPVQTGGDLPPRVRGPLLPAVGQAVGTLGGAAPSPGARQAGGWRGRRCVLQERHCPWPQSP